MPKGRERVSENVELPKMPARSALGEREVGTILVFAGVAEHVEEPRPCRHEHARGARLFVLAERKIPLRAVLRAREQRPELARRPGPSLGHPFPPRPTGGGRAASEPGPRDGSDAR